MIAFLLIGGTMSAQQYTPNAHSYDNNMPIVATVLLDGVAQTGGELGAFIGNEVRGTATVQALLDNTYWIQVYYNSDTESSETITFKYFDGTDEYDITTTVAVNPEGVGTKAAPQELEIVTAITQTTSIEAGWTWWSTPIEQNGNNGLSQLENSISDYGIRIQAKSASRIKRGNGWNGPLAAIVNEECYKINVSDASVISMTGTLARPEDHTVTIDNGWNWIGYPVSISQAVGVAMANHTPETGDVIMTPSGSSTYRAGQWRPSINLNPGTGYLYNSKSELSKSFVYAVNRNEAPQEIEEDSYFVANIHEYEDCMVILAVVYVGKEEQRGESLEIGAFVNGKCTGRSKIFYLDELDRYYTLLTVGGVDGDKITFAMIDESKEMICDYSDNSFTFVKNGILGDFDNPSEIHFNAWGIGENAMRISLYPNPVERNQEINLMLPLNEVISDITIINALGSVVRHETGALKPIVYGMPVSGVYTVKVSCNSGNTYFGKIVVK